MKEKKNKKKTPPCNRYRVIGQPERRARKSAEVQREEKGEDRGQSHEQRSVSVPGGCLQPQSIRFVHLTAEMFAKKN